MSTAGLRAEVTLLRVTSCYLVESRSGMDEGIFGMRRPAGD